MLISSQTFIIFGVLSFAIGEEGLDKKIFSHSFQEDFNYDSLTPIILSLKEKCDQYPDAFPCLYINSNDEETTGDTQISFLSQGNDETASENDDTASENNTRLFGYTKPPEENEKVEEIVIEVPDKNTDRRLAKRFFSFRRGYPQAKGFKRGPGFRSWGGKRDPSYIEKAMQKRTKFTFWGGKRYEKSFWNDLLNSGFEENKLTNKRTKFVTWDGKRSKDLKKKGSKFVSWGGKRSGGLEKKGSKFVSWGGKRNEGLEEKKSGFQSWGGKKRADDLLQEIVKKDKETPIFYDYTTKRNPGLQYKDLEEPFKDHVPKRPQFQSWGGKRSSQSGYPPLRLYFYPYLTPKYNLRKLSNSEEKRKFSSWGGKRSENPNIIADIEKSDLNDYNFWNEEQYTDGNEKPIFKTSKNK